MLAPISNGCHKFRRISRIFFFDYTPMEKLIILYFIANTIE